MKSLPPDQYAGGALTLREQAAEVAISDQPTYNVAVELGRGIKALREQAEQHHRKMISTAHAAHKAALEALNIIDAPLADAYRMVSAKITAWDLEQAAIIRRAQIEADKTAREMAEAQAQRDALEAIDAGACQEEVDAIVAAPIVPLPAVIAPTFQRAAGVSKPVPHYSARVDDMKKLAAAVMTGKVQPLAIVGNQVFLNQQAKSLGPLFEQSFPGCSLVTTYSSGIRGKA